MIYIDRGVYIICYYIIKYRQIAIKKKKIEKSKKSVLYLTCTTDDRHDNDARLYIIHIQYCVCVCVYTAAVYCTHIIIIILQSVLILDGGGGGDRSANKLCYACFSI